MKIFIVSDTHGFHKDLQVPDVDMMIHCGDCSNVKDKARNSVEVLDFLEWYERVPVEKKIYIPGNHDSSIEYGMFTKEYFLDRGINLLVHESLEIAGLKLFGSPYTPTFGQWSYMKARDKLFKYWQQIPEDLDILITHGPPKTILDLSYNPVNQAEFCGDRALLTQIKQLSIKYHCFGHIHDCQDILNYGKRTIDDCNTTFINAAMVLDGNFDKGLIHKGHIIEI